MEKFDSTKGLITEVQAPRDVSADLVKAENIIRGLPKPMFIEDLIELVQKTCSLTNNEVYGLIQKVDAELKPKMIEPITK